MGEHFDKSVDDTDDVSQGTNKFVSQAEKDNIPSGDENGALAGTDGTPSGANPFVTDSDPRNTNDRDPNAHAIDHQNGGADEISVAGLSGELADDQPPKAHTHTHASTTGQGTDDHHNEDHASRHNDGGADEIASASEGAKGKIEIATQPEIDTGSDDLRAITPLKLKTLLDKIFYCDNDNNTGESNTALATPQTKNDKNFTIPVDGDYLISVSCLMSQSDTGNEGNLDIYVENSTSYKETNFEMISLKYSDGFFFCKSLTVKVTLTAGTRNVKVRFWTTTATKTIYIKESLLTIKKCS